jgi:hypothetical protein
MAKKSKANTTVVKAAEKFSSRVVVAIVSLAGLLVVLAGVWVSQTNPVTEQKLQLSPTRISDEELGELIETSVKTGDRESSRILAGLREDAVKDARIRAWIWPEDFLIQLWTELTLAPEAVRSSLPYQHLAQWVGTRLRMTQ